MNKRLLMTLAVGLLVSVCAWSQTLVIGGHRAVRDNRNQIWLCTLPQASFGSNQTLTVSYDESVTGLTIEGKAVASGDTYTFAAIEGGKGYAVTATVDGTTVTGDITFTWLPVLELTGTFSNTYAEGTVTVNEPDSAQANPWSAKLKWRGGATNAAGKHKRNYRVKFLNKEGKKKNRHILGLRKDNSWILDAGQMDLLRVRNRVSTDLWLDMANSPWYINEQPNAINGSRGAMVEVVLNNEYAGIYNMCEPIDRKQMQLERYDTINNEFRGELWTAYAWSRTATMYDVKTPDNTKATWDGSIETKYPLFDDVNPTDYSTLYDNFMFAKRASHDQQLYIDSTRFHFDMPVLMDYYLFITVLQALDNESKNIYYACQDKQNNTLVTMVPWDLDVCIGQNYSQNVDYPDMIKPEREVNWISNLALANLSEIDQYMDQIKTRYWELRKTLFDPDNLVARYRNVINSLENSGAAAREEARWSGDSDIAGKTLDLSDEMDYVEDWLRRRIAYLDENVFNETGETWLTGDVNGDGEVTVADVNTLIDIVLGTSVDDATMKRADVNEDSEITVADVNSVIDIILNS